MHMFWWPQLHLLLLIQLLEPNITNHKFCAEALLNLKTHSKSPRQPICGIGRYPCLRQWASFAETSSLPPQTRAIDITRNFLPFHTAIQLQEKLYRPRHRTAATVDGDGDVPTLTPLPTGHVRKQRKQLIAAIIGGVCALLVVIVVVVLVYLCLMRVRRFIRRTSETTTSSGPSPPIDLERVSTSSFVGAHSPYGEHGARQLAVAELERATGNFSQSTVIGEGRFGFVYKGLLQDGSIVAIKRHLHSPTQHFFHKVRHIASVHHKHLVKLIGYCQDDHQQCLVYEYLPNGNVGNHLYSKSSPIGKLNIRQRLQIALGAARGLEHLHSLVPPLVHMHFRTSNVLVDENFVAKVSDYGLEKLFSESNRAGSSSAIDCFADPELDLSQSPSKRWDVYSFGVFLVELISGREANAHESLVLQAMEKSRFEDIVDEAVMGGGRGAAEKMMGVAASCMDGTERRVSMGRVVEELEEIEGREFGHLDGELGENIGGVALGSELFQ